MQPTSLTYSDGEFVATQYTSDGWLMSATTSYNGGNYIYYLPGKVEEIAPNYSRITYCPLEDDVGVDTIHGPRDDALQPPLPLAFAPATPPATNSCHQQRCLLECCQARERSGPYPHKPVGALGALGALGAC